MELQKMNILFFTKNVFQIGPIYRINNLNSIPFRKAIYTL